MSRANRTWVLMLILWGRGAFRPLGKEHPDVPLAKAGLFCGKTPPAGAAPGSTSPDNVVWECYWRMMTARIEARQFFGAAYYGLPLFTGLRALVQTYALVRAAAQCRAAAHAAASIGPADVHYAVGAVDHSYGRSRLLQMRWWRATEIYFSGTRYARLLGTLT